MSSSVSTTHMGARQEDPLLAACSPERFNPDLDKKGVILPLFLLFP